MTSGEGSHSSTPRIIINEDDRSRDPDVTLYEDICSEKKKASESIINTMSEDDIIGVRAESVGEINIVEDFVEGENWKTTLPDTKDENEDDVYQESKSVKRRKENRRESINSNIFINILMFKTFHCYNFSFKFQRIVQWLQMNHDVNIELESLTICRMKTGRKMQFQFQWWL